MVNTLKIGSNTDGSFTTAFSNSFFGPMEKSHRNRLSIIKVDFRFFFFFIEKKILCASIRRF